MTSDRRVVFAAAALVALATVSLVDLARLESRTLVVYTTPALRDVLETGILPAFEEKTGVDVSPVYVPAGQQYNRLRMGGGQPEADLFLHASPLYLEKGFAESHVDPLASSFVEDLDARFRSGPVEGGLAWVAFAWSPLVEVYPASARAAPDLASFEGDFGFPHPLLSNNGAYAVLFFSELDPAVGERALAATSVQPTNARANIGGVADGSFDLTLGYEAVVRFYQDQGAAVAFDVPLVGGERVTTPVLFSAALIRGERHSAAEALVAHLLSPAAQARLAEFHFRSVDPSVPAPAGSVAIGDDVRIVSYDWARSRELEALLPAYEVKE